MSSTIISDSEDLPVYRLWVTKQFVTHQGSFGQLISQSRADTARRIAEMIVKEEKFFSLKVEGDFGTMNADVIVLTQAELHALMREQFLAGQRRAVGFMSPHSLGDRP